MTTKEKGEEQTFVLLRIDSENELPLFRLAPADNIETEYLRLKIENNRFKIDKSSGKIDEPQISIQSKLDSLYLDWIQSEQSGIEENEVNVFEEKPFNAELIRVDTKSLSLRQVYDMINDGDINLSPDFQRHFVWDLKRQSLLIESVLLRIPLPIFYFAQDKEGKISVIDGLQRLTAIRNFMNNTLRIRHLEYLTNCEGKCYNELEQRYIRWLNMTQITANIIDPSAPASVKYDIFRRINTGGKPLTLQEIRNCLAAPKVREVLNKMINQPSFKETMDGSITDSRMEAQELALRFILFHQFYEKDKTLSEYNGKIETALDGLTSELSKNSVQQDELEHYIQLFDQTLRNAQHLFGVYAFRKCKLDHLKPNSKKQLINKALFVCWTVLLSHYETKKIFRFDSGKLIYPLAERITTDTQLLDYLTNGTNSKANVLYTFKVAQEIINEYLERLT
ncbi:MAG: DUF262 domain-containing protein [Planctomycetaceae bacterium]|nr:DUF262 domain-containing protein [Planctomycetaceae bacterium]